QALFGKNMLAPRLVEIAGLVGMVFAFGRLAHAFFDSRTAGYVGGAIASLIHAELEFWHTGQPETFGGFLTVFAVLVTIADWSRKKKYWAWLLVGVLFGMTFLLKPPIGGGALVCAAYLAKKEQFGSGRLRAAVWPVLIVGGSALAIVGLCGAWFALRGGWPALRWTLGEFTPGYTSLSWEGRRAPEMLYHATEEAFFKFSALGAAGVIAAATISPIHGREREGVFLMLGIIALHITGVAMQGKFFPYHYAATLPLIAFIAGLGYYKLWRRCLGGGIGGVAAFVAFVVACTAMRQAAYDVPQGFWERSQARLSYLFRQAPYDNREALDRDLYYVADFNLDADRNVALDLRSRTHGSEPVFIWGFEPIIYWLADRAPSSRFIYNVPQRTEWQKDYSRRELMRELRQRPPKVFVVQHNDVFPSVTGRDSDSKHDLLSFPELLVWVDEHYEQVKSIEDFDIYEKRASTLADSARGEQ
ncbi:MAG TPA: glycosyltransferase family 39 protein, partial [Polyangiaceae bacterium]|nr:glycosyltransferase family 39 protein [Polyangiaceae bacterium]